MTAMLTGPHNLMDWIVGGVVFAMIFSVWLGVVLVWVGSRRQRQEQIEKRLRGPFRPEETEAEGRMIRLWHEGREVATTAPGTRRPTLMLRLDDAVRSAGWHMPAPTLLALFGCAVIVAAVVAFVLTGSLLSVAAVVAALLVAANIYVHHRIEQRAAEFEARFLDALEIVVRSLRAGHPLIGAFRFVADEGGPPVNELFEEICQEQSLGVSIEEAVRKVMNKYPSPDLRLFTSSVVVQLRTGGPLADMMQRLADVIRDRMHVTRRARVLTAQTQFSKRVLLALPIVLFAVLNLVNPHYMEPLLSSHIGKVLLAFAGISLLLGTWVMNRMAVVRF